MLSLQKLLDMQKELDKTILENAQIKEYPLENIKLALLVELGELANVWQGFKHWKKHKEINREKLLEEFADCLSFALSLENQLHQSDLDINYYVENLNPKFHESIDIMILQFNGLFDEVCRLDNALEGVIICGLWLGITPEEMEQAYYAKNKVNYERQNNGY
ncbi:MAG: hypothetical protein K0S61_4783 [Anaerocolumna sp.]|jgi:dimeric dUTPase (all-alpha-NTP-PPase superfamily)|nr:hypothetical protein [Anaerocolumna sp.]